RPLGAVLESLEAGPASFIRHYELAVEGEPLVRQRREGPRNLGERGRDVVPVAGDEPCLSSLVRGADAVPVELELEQPSGLRERLLARLGEHRLRFPDRDGAARGLETRELLRNTRRPVLPRLQLLDREPGQ